MNLALFKPIRAAVFASLVALFVAAFATRMTGVGEKLDVLIVDGQSNHDWQQSTDAIKAALNPTPGPWLYFVAVNLKTGETVFSETQQQHEQAVQQLEDWCNASPANDAYCK